MLSATFLGVSLGFTIFPLLILPLEKSLNISHSLSGLLYTVMFVASATGRFIESISADYFGKTVFILSSGFLMASASIAVALAPTYSIIAVSVFFMGLGNGLFLPAGFAAVSELFTSQKGKFIGLYDSIFPLSALAAYGVVSVGNFLGSWRYSIGLIGLYLIFSFSVLFFFYGVENSNSRGKRQEKFSLLQQIRSGIGKARNCPVFLKMVTLIIPVSIFAKGAINFLPAYLVQARGLPQGVANTLYIVFMGLIIPGKTVSGSLLDRKGARWTFLSVITFVLIGFAIFTQVPGLWALALGLLIVAPARGGAYTVMHANLLDNLPEDSVNLLYGLFMVSLAVFGSIGPGLVGTLIDNIGFKWSFVVLLFVVATTIPIGLSLKGKK